MTPFQRVRRARTVLAGAVILAGALWSAATGMAALALAAAAGAVGALPSRAAGLVVPLAVAAALGTLGAVLWKERSVWSLERVALWLEEHAPQLKYALVTLVDPRYAKFPLRGEGHAALVGAADGADFEAVVRRSAGRGLAWATGACALAGAVLFLLLTYAPVPAFANPVGGRTAPKELPNRLKKLRAEIIPPAYTGLPRRVVSEPLTHVAGLYGTRIRFLGEGPADGVTAILEKDSIARDTIAAVADENGWAIPVPMPRSPALIDFQDRTYSRPVVLQPLPDSVPGVILRLPAKDTTYRYDRPPTGQLVLEAEIKDDYGIDTARFEILASTGGEENFVTNDRSTVRVAFGGQRHGTLRASVSFTSLGVSPGTVLHIRAVAYDRNNVDTLPGKGISDTRTLRVATKQEYDTVYVTPAPPLPIDSLFVSQRLLNMRTDTLIRFRRPKISFEQYQDTSIHYADKQMEIRNRVEKVIAIVEDDGVGGHTETEMSLLLRAAADSMWSARTYLAIGMPDSAMTPYMKEALRLLELARKAQKYYIRGTLKARPVDIARVRLSGQDTAHAVDRTPRGIPEDLRRALRERLAAVTPLAMASPKAAVAPLMRIQVAALQGAPAVAAALQAAIDSANGGKPVAAALARTQRLLDPPPRVTTGPTEWGGGLLP